jgi:hypothetical protein
MRAGFPAPVHRRAGGSRGCAGSVAKGAGLLPIAHHGRGLEAGGAQAGDIGVAGAGDILGGFVEDVEVMTEPRGIGGRLEHEATGEMAELVPIGRDNAEDVALEVVTGMTATPAPRATLRARRISAVRR